MAPEYAMDGLFSIKSDVFSFGVLVLEILSSTKNRGFYNSDHELNLLGYVSHPLKFIAKLFANIDDVYNHLVENRVCILTVMEAMERRKRDGNAR